MAAVIGADMVAERHYFLEAFQMPLAIWCVRGSLMAAAAAAFIIYIKLKGRNGE